MTIRVAYAQFLTGHGVPPRQAETVAARIAAKVDTRQPMTADEIALTEAFLARPGADRAAERPIGLAILTTNNRANTGAEIRFGDGMTGRRPPPAAGRTPAHTPEWTNPNEADPGAATDQPGARTVPSQAKVVLFAPAASGTGKQTVGASQTISVGANRAGPNAGAWTGAKVPGPPAPFVPAPLPNIDASAIRTLVTRIASAFGTTAGADPNV